MDKELKARLQHAVIGEGSTTTSSIPKKGEIVFNDILDNLKVGDGSTQYSQLNNLIKTIAAAAGSDIGDVGTPSVTTSTSGNTTTFTFHQLKGEQGDQGDAGDTGVGISTITKTGTSGLVDTYTITYTDRSTSTYTITNGADGTGISVKATESECQVEGDAYIEQDSTSAYYGHIMILTSTSPRTFTDGGNVQGPTGRGISSVAWTSNSGGQPQGTAGTTDTYTITYTTGTPTTSTFIVYNGENGTLWSQGTAVTTTTSSVPTGINVGDYYLNTSTLDVWKCVSTTASTKWSLVCNIRGSKWFYGSASPATVSGSKSGDMYLNTSDGGVWTRSNGSPESWQYIANITGPQGLKGDTGDIPTLYNLTLQLGNDTAVVYNPSSSSQGFTIPDFTGGTASTSAVHGLVPVGTTTNQYTFLRGDGTWKEHSIIHGTSSAAVQTQTTNNTNTYINLISRVHGGNQGDVVHGYIKLTGSNAATVSGNNGTVTINVPVASTNALGTFKLKSDTKVNATSSPAGSGNYYPVQLNTNDVAYVRIPSSQASVSVNLYGNLDENDGVTDLDEQHHIVSGYIEGSTASELQTGNFNIVAGTNINFSNLVTDDGNNDRSGLVINADLPIATSGVNGKLIVDSNASSWIPLYKDTTHNHVSVPIYYAEYAGSSAGPAHYINVYDIANAIASDRNLKEWFKEILK